MDFLKEIAITFSEIKKRNFEKFMGRKRPNSARKDIQIFRTLYSSYSNSSENLLNLKGQPNYHAIRKRITKELINFLILESSKSEIKDNNRELMLLVAKYFIGFKKYAQAWQILEKEEKIFDKNKDFLLNMKVQRLKLSILPYYPSVNFELIKKKTLELQFQQSKVDEFQLYFVQIKNMFISKIENGEVDISNDIFKKAIEQYDNIKDYINHPDIHLKIIEIIRAEYAVAKNFNSLSKILINYYNQINFDQFFKTATDTIANIEYIMAYTFLEIRNFKLVKMHLSNLKRLMNLNEQTFFNYLGKSVAIESFTYVFEKSIEKGINLIENTFSNFKTKITIREKLNLTLNLTGFYCVIQDYRKANQLILSLNQSELYYLKNMGKEWVLRKDIIRVIILIELKHVDLADKLISSIKKSNSDLMNKKQYKMVYPFINAIDKYIQSPFEVNLAFLEEIEELANLNKQKAFQDPRLIIYYAWLRSKYEKKKVYDILSEEYQQLSKGVK